MCDSDEIRVLEYDLPFKLSTNYCPGELNRTLLGIDDYSVFKYIEEIKQHLNCSTEQAVYNLECFKLHKGTEAEVVKSVLWEYEKEEIIDILMEEVESKKLFNRLTSNVFQTSGGTFIRDLELFN